jgi:multiple sugar transport system permease protein
LATASATETTTPTRLRSSMLGARLREAGWGYGFALVPFAVFGIFFVYPFAYAIYISFFHWGILGKQPGAAGTYNYSKVLHDHIFHIALKNIAEYALAVVPLEMALGLGLALLINQKIRGRNFFRSGFYFPSIASSVAITVIILYMFAPRGPFNTFFGFSTDWFGNASTVGWGIVGLNGWTTSGTVMIFYLAALQSISNDVYEAAALDGAGAWRTFWKITFPLLKPGHFFVSTLLVIGGLKMFDQAFIASGGTGGPNNSTLVPVLYLYRVAFADVRFGFAAAVGIVLMLLMITLTLAQRLTFGRRTD